MKQATIPPLEFVDPAPTIVADGGSGDVVLETEFLRTFAECFELWKTRHRKYGRGNISEFGALGCLVRSSDKKARLKEFYVNHNTQNFTDETVTDSWEDMVNYAIMGLMCAKDRWRA